ncbi:deoxynucleoside kinase isoform X2 [Bactrocera tryoni]|uniref:deoxynucleoside kinase isoform X2 n=1 Tax=Bactrocera tryoni TaxID=59916 RepID=UPI001A96EC39|nr:deoxynucleoside kinase isoform X2 [Bactrocera tryoni]
MERLILKRLLGTMTSLKPINAAVPKYGVGTQPFTVLIEGNIGSGKTTFIKHFQKFEDKICAMTEPVEKWRNFKGYNLLELMYIDPDRWAMPFQSYVMLTMLERHTKPTDKPIKILERSLYSAKYCFVENLHKCGLIHNGMYEILKEWYSYVEDITHIQADLIVYLRTTPEVVYERIRKRARSEEACVPLEYIKQLHELHEDWLIRKKAGCNIKVLEIEADLDLSEIDREYKRSENVITASIQQQRPAVTASPSKRSDFLG